MSQRSQLTTEVALFLCLFWNFGQQNSKYIEMYLPTQQNGGLLDLKTKWSKSFWISWSWMWLWPLCENFDKCGDSLLHFFHICFISPNYCKFNWKLETGYLYMSLNFRNIPKTRPSGMPDPTTTLFLVKNVWKKMEKKTNVSRVWWWIWGSLHLAVRSLHPGEDIGIRLNPHNFFVFSKVWGRGIWKCAINKNNENLSNEATISSFDPTTLDLGGTSSGGRGALDGPGGRWMFNYRILQILKLAIILWNEILIL